MGQMLEHFSVLLVTAGRHAILSSMFVVMRDTCSTITHILPTSQQVIASMQLAFTAVHFQS